MSEPSPIVLVVDDEIQIRRFLRTGFELNGFVVHEADTGANGSGGGARGVGGAVDGRGGHGAGIGAEEAAGDLGATRADEIARRRRGRY